MSNSLEDRLKAHSNAFDGLLSLIPAKYYYDEETSNQWQQKKKSKEEHKANKRLKLDPELTKESTAKNALNNIAKDAKPVVLPGQRKIPQQTHEDEEESNEDAEDDNESIGYGSEELDNDSDDDDDDNSSKSMQSNSKRPLSNEDDLIASDITMVFNDEGDVVGDDTAEQRRVQNLRTQAAISKSKGKELKPASSSKKIKKELTEEEKKERAENLAKLRAKLSEKISTLKEKRKAPGSKVPGAATSRQQILEERRKKEELRKQLKRKRDTTTDADSSSDEDNDDEIAGPEKSDVIFSNIEFNDGDRATSDLSSTRKTGKKKGPSNNDIKGHLKKIEKEKARIAELDEDEQKKVEEKSKWNRALANVQGIKVKDDEKLLKKASRRKESQKRKSEREWVDRKQLVADTIKAKADRREENLRIRRQNKGKDKKHQVKQLKTFKGVARQKRAGFEGKFKSGKSGKGAKK